MALGAGNCPAGNLSRTRRASPACRTPFAAGADTMERKHAGTRRFRMSTVDNPTQHPAQTGTARVKRGMAEMLKGGVIMDVVTPDQAKIAEDAGAVAVM